MQHSKFIPSIALGLRRIAAGLAVSSGLTFSVAAQPPSFRVVQLQGTEALPFATGFSMNDAGSVVGVLTDQYANSASRLPVYWPAGVTLPTVLAVPSNSSNPVPYGINNHEQIAGVASLAGNRGGSVGLRWDGPTTVTVLAEKGNPVGKRVLAVAINDSGAIAGTAGRYQAQIARVWTINNQIVALGSLAPAGEREGLSEATAINSAGTVVGNSTLVHGTTGGNFFYPFVWTQSAGMVNISPQGTSGVTAQAINNAGVIVGTYGVTTPVGVLWAADLQMQTPPGMPAFPYDVNDAGVVVGNDTQQRAVWWTAADGGRLVVDLIDKADPLLAAIKRDGIGARAVNANGWLLVNHNQQGGDARSYVLIPQ